MKKLYDVYMLLLAGFLPLFGWKDEAARKARLDQIMTGAVPYFLSRSEELLKLSGGQHFVGNRVKANYYCCKLAYWQNLNAHR